MTKVLEQSKRKMYLSNDRHLARKPTPLKLSIPTQRSNKQRSRDRFTDDSCLGNHEKNIGTTVVKNPPNKSLNDDSSTLVMNHNDKMLLRKLALHMRSKLVEDRKQVEKEFSQEYMQWKKKTTVEKDVLKNELERAKKTLAGLSGKVQSHIQALSEHCLKEVKAKEQEQVAINAEIQASWQKTHEKLFQYFQSEARAL